MPDGLRSRIMAPVYALMISFFAVLLLGAAMHNRGTGGTSPTTTQAPAAPTVDIRLVTTTVDERNRSVPVAATGLKGASVKILAESGQDLTVGENAEIPWTTSSALLTVCVQLPEGWSAPRTNTKRLPKFSCWEPIDLSPKANPTGRIDLVVTKPRG